MSLRQHLCGSLVWSQQEDLSWTRTQQLLQRFVLPADRSMLPQLEGVISARLTEPSAQVSKYTSCALVLLLVALRGPCFLIQAGRRWTVVISMLVLSRTITDTFCHRTSPREESTCKINHTAATQHTCDGQRRVGDSQVAPNNPNRHNKNPN